MVEKINVKINFIYDKIQTKKKDKDNENDSVERNSDPDWLEWMEKDEFEDFPNIKIDPPMTPLKFFMKHIILFSVFGTLICLLLVILFVAIVYMVYKKCVLSETPKKPKKNKNNTSKKDEHKKSIMESEKTVQSILKQDNSKEVGKMLDIEKNLKDTVSNLTSEIEDENRDIYISHTYSEIFDSIETINEDLILHQEINSKKNQTPYLQKKQKYKPNEHFYINARLPTPPNLPESSPSPPPLPPPLMEKNFKRIPPKPLPRASSLMKISVERTSSQFFKDKRQQPPILPRSVSLPKLSNEKSVKVMVTNV